ncbi:MAG: GGDEF domain-containing protein [Burkholderiaceae bacterium]
MTTSPALTLLTTAVSTSNEPGGDDAPGLLTLFRRVMQAQALTPHFQPIVNLRTGTLLGFEGLIRGPLGTPLHSPAKLFSVARMAGEMAQLEQLCRQIHVRTFVEQGLPGKLFLNISPESLVAPPPDDQPDAAAWLDTAQGLTGNQLVLELTESFSSAGYDALREAVGHYRRAGSGVALDDLGEGFSSLRLWAELRPDFVKIDKYFINGIDTDSVKRQFVRSILEMARQSGTVVIAEGIETEDQYPSAVQLGIAYGQGYWLGRPVAHPQVPLDDAVVRVIARENALIKAGRERIPLSAASVRKILREVPTVPHTLPTNAVYELFDAHPQVHVVAVLKGTRPIGLIHRLRMLDKLARPYHRELYGNKSCEQFIDNQPLVVEHTTPLGSLGHLIAEDNPYQLSDGFIITQDGEFIGVGTGLDLIRAITQLQLNAARYANPLTGLPGSVPINEHMDALLAANESFVVCYADLDQFKPFNDLYSYRKGDEIIQLTAGLLTRYTDAARDFVGHIGGDDFIIVFRSPDWQRRCRQILDGFLPSTRHLYRQEHLAAQGYLAENRAGQRVFHGLVSVSIGAVRVPPSPALSTHQLAEFAARAKTQAKKQAGNALFIERRALVPA